MKRFRKWIAMALMLCLTFCALQTTVLAAEDVLTTQPSRTADGYTYVDEVVYAVAQVNIRTGPSTSYTIVGRLTPGAPIRRIAVGNNGWSKVTRDGQIYYMYSAYLSTTRPEGYTTNLDDADLTRQIAIANGLNRVDYTKESWSAVSVAQDYAYQVLGGTDQKAVDAATQKLKDAIAGLVRMDYTGLEASLAEVEKLVKSAALNELWMKLTDAVDRGRALLTSSDQAAVEAAASEIDGLLAQLKLAINEQQTPDVVLQEVPVEVPPTDDYCNIPIHHVFPVLFFVSLALNLTLVTVIVVYVTGKKRKQRDATPLVDYDIFDDAL